LTDDRPEGLVYRPDLLDEADERALLEEIERLEFDEIRMHGVVAKRTARHFGFDYDYERRAAVEEAEPIPDWLLPVRAAAAGLAGVEPDELVEALVQRYPEGAQIGWHRDAPMFGTVVGVSLLSPARMRFRRDKGGERQTFELELEPRSGYVLAGPARSAWQHHLPPAKSLRYSITFRTLRRRVPSRATTAARRRR
jgi:DNA oxidative demethylase